MVVLLASGTGSDLQETVKLIISGFATSLGDIAGNRNTGVSDWLVHKVLAWERAR